MLFAGDAKLPSSSECCLQEMLNYHTQVNESRMMSAKKVELSENVQIALLQHDFYDPLLSSDLQVDLASLVLYLIYIPSYTFFIICLCLSDKKSSNHAHTIC